MGNHAAAITAMDMAVHRPLIVTACKAGWQTFDMADMWRVIWYMIHSPIHYCWWCIIIAGSCRLVARVICHIWWYVVLVARDPWGRTRAMGLYGSGTILPELVRSVLILVSWQQVWGIMWDAWSCISQLIISTFDDEFYSSIRAMTFSWHDWLCVLGVWGMGMICTERPRRRFSLCCSHSSIWILCCGGFWR